MFPGNVLEDSFEQSGTELNGTHAFTLHTKTVPDQAIRR